MSFVRELRCDGPSAYHWNSSHTVEYSLCTNLFGADTDLPGGWITVQYRAYDTDIAQTLHFATFSCAAARLYGLQDEFNKLREEQDAAHEETIEASRYNTEEEP